MNSIRITLTMSYHELNQITMNLITERLNRTKLNVTITNVTSKTQPAMQQRGKYTHELHIQGTVTLNSKGEFAERPMAPINYIGYVKIKLNIVLYTCIHDYYTMYMYNLYNLCMCTFIKLNLFN
jgi:hypothetical protein